MVSYKALNTTKKSDFILVVTPKAAKAFCLATRPGPFLMGLGQGS